VRNASARTSCADFAGSGWRARTALATRITTDTEHITRGAQVQANALRRGPLGPGLAREPLGLASEPSDERHPSPANFVYKSLTSAPSMSARRVGGGGSLSKTSRTAGEAWL
jgi:hypothetical protein